MIIRCPECQFERSIDSSKIPSSAAIATCPKCRHRFRFRALASDETPDVSPAGHAGHAAQAPQAGDMASRRAPDDVAPGVMPHAGPAMEQDEDDELPAAFRRGPSVTSPPPASGMPGAPGTPSPEDNYAGEDDHVGEPRPVAGADTPDTANPDASSAASHPASTTPSGADVPRNAHGNTDLSHPGDDPLPPGAVIPGRSSAPTHNDGHDAPNGRNAAAGSADGQRRPGSPRDIWDAVASVGDRWRKHSESRTRPGNGDLDGRRNHTGGPANDRDDTPDGTPNGTPDGWNAGNHGDSFPPRDGGHPGERDAPLPPWAASARSEVPWENLDRVGFFPGLYQTILRVMLAAPRFFSGVRSSGSLKRPVAFYLLIGIFQALTERLWYLMSMRAFGGFIEDPQLHAWMGSVTHDMSLPMTLLISPFTLLLQLAVLSVLYHVMIRLVEPRAADLPTTVRVISYSAAPTVLSVVPLVGPVVGSLWFVVCTFVGVKYAHRLPWSRTALAIGPLLGLGFALTVQLLRMFMSSVPM